MPKHKPRKASIRTTANSVLQHSIDIAIHAAMNAFWNEFAKRADFHKTTIKSWIDEKRQAISMHEALATLDDEDGSAETEVLVTFTFSFQTDPAAIAASRKRHASLMKTDDS